jgi:2-polyprenyl-3-methyl-5-hydroxy-6-metoxy-1,4-benzoquinol methylase
MENRLRSIISRIRLLDPMNAKKLDTRIPFHDYEYCSRANEFFEKYECFLQGINKTLDFGIDCYLRVCADTLYEQIQFAKTGEYTCKSFAEAYRNVYGNPKVMEYYMHGLLLSQFLWVQHYEILKYFSAGLGTKTDTVKYLEVGGGHGLYISEAIKLLGDSVSFDVVDISPSSIEMARAFIGNPSVQFHRQDIFLYESDSPYDFITLGEVLEHMEQPAQLLRKLSGLLSDKGNVFVTVPANAPAIDHIYLFRDAEEIREILGQGGFSVVDETVVYAEKIPKAKVGKITAPFIYSAFLQKKM